MQVARSCTPTARSSAARPSFLFSGVSIGRPWRTRMRFSPVSGATSATVPMVTRSRKRIGALGRQPARGAQRRAAG